MKVETSFSTRIFCNFLSEVIFIVLPIAAIVAIKVHVPGYSGSLFSERELPIASILLCGSAIRRRYLLNYKKIGQRQTEDLFGMDVLIAFLTASSLLFSFVTLSNHSWRYIEPAQVSMFLISLILLYMVCQLEEKGHQYLRMSPVKKEMNVFFRVFRSELVQVEQMMDECTNVALQLTVDLITDNHSCCDSKQHVEDLQLEINLDHINNIIGRFEIIRKRSVKACEHLAELEKVVKTRQSHQL